MFYAFSPRPAKGGRPNFFTLVFIFVSLDLLLSVSLLLFFFSGLADRNSLTRKQAFTFCSEGVLSHQPVLHS